MASYLFGSGYLFLKDSQSNVHQVGVMSDVSVDFEATSKELRGAQQYPLAVAIASRKVSGKAKSANIDGKALGSLLSGSVTAGRNVYVTNTPRGFASTGVTASFTGTGFVADMGVLDANGNPMQVTASAPAVGYYTVGAVGNYGFNASQAGTGSFSYTYSTGSGYTTALNNQDQGLTPTYELHLQETFQGESFGVKLVSVTIPKLSTGFKSEDFASEDIDFQAQANAAGQVGFLYWE